MRRGGGGVSNGNSAAEVARAMMGDPAIRRMGAFRRTELRERGRERSIKDVRMSLFFVSLGWRATPKTTSFAASPYPCTMTGTISSE